MILFGSGTGVLIEAWKVTKAVDISVVPAAPGAVFPYKLDIKGVSFLLYAVVLVLSSSTDKHVLSEDEKKTQE